MPNKALFKNDVESQKTKIREKLTLIQQQTHTSCSTLQVKQVALYKKSKRKKIGILGMAQRIH